MLVWGAGTSLHFLNFFGTCISCAIIRRVNRLACEEALKGPQEREREDNCPPRGPAWSIRGDMWHRVSVRLL